MKAFEQNLNTAVFTTKFVLEGRSPILFVFHYDDGSWQFSGAEESLSDNDYRIVSLGEIIEHDKSLTEIVDMPINSQATRLSIGSPWRFSNNN